MAETRIYPVGLDLSEPVPGSIDLGARFTVVIAVMTESGGDLSGAVFQVLDGETVVERGALPAVTRRDPHADDIDPRNGPVDLRAITSVSLTAPARIGSFDWTFLVPAQEIGGVAHGEASLRLRFTTAEHRTSLAAWDVPSPVEAGETFVFRVGAKCTACCHMEGQIVELRDEEGRVVSGGRLGAETWPGTEGLFWTRIEARAPETEGLRQWTVAFPASGFELPHQGAGASVGFMVVAPGRHLVSVTVVERGTGAAVADAQVRVGFHRAVTDEAGVARFLVAPGEHRLFVWKANFDAPESMLDIQADTHSRVEAEALPEPDPYARWQG